MPARVRSLAAARTGAERVRSALERPPRRLSRAIAGAAALAALAASGAAFAQPTCTPALQPLCADQAKVLAPFATLLNSPAGLAALEANMQTEEAIYADPTGTGNAALNAARRTLAAENALVLQAPQSILIGAFPSNPNFYFDAFGVPTTTTPIPPDVANAANTAVGLLATGASTGDLKSYFGGFNVYGLAYGAATADPNGDPRPFQTSSSIAANPFTNANSSAIAYQIQQTGGNAETSGDPQDWQSYVSSPSFPSGHSAIGNANAIMFAILAPGYYQQFLQSGVDFGYSRNVFAAHYPLDVIGGRILATYVTAETLAGDNPLYASTALNLKTNPNALVQLATDMQTYLAGAGLTSGGASPYAAACADLAKCLGDGTIPTAAAFAQAAQTYAYDLTYNLPAIGPTNLAPVVPTDAYVLIQSRFPYLSVDQLNQILATTELPSGGALDNGSGWARLNLYAAAGGYGAFPSDVTVALDKAAVGFGAFDVWSNSISGPGGLTLQGSGTLVLAGDNTYAGGTNVEGGALAVTGSLLGPLSISPGASFVVGGTGTFAGALTNDGGVDNLGVMTGTFAGSGTFANSGFLSGVGGFGSLDLLAGSAIAPGNPGYSVGTMQVARDLTVAPGAVYQVQIAGDSADQIQVGGTATLSGGAVVASLIGDNPTLGHPYAILTANSGAADSVIGGFASATTDSLPFLQASLSSDLDHNSVFLTLTRNGVAYASVATSPNQVAAANALDAGGTGGGLGLAIASQSAAGARQSFGALSGEIHASAVSAAFDDARLPREAVLDRLASLDGAPATGAAAGFAATKAIAAPTLPTQAFAAWGQVFGSFGRIGGDGDAATLDRSVGGFILGVDASPDPRYRLGVAGGYTQSSLGLDARASSGHVDSTFAGVYGGASFDALRVRGGALYAYNRYGTDRSVAFPGFNDAESVGYGGDTLQAFGEAGWRIGLSGLSTRTSIEPFVGATAMRIDAAGFSEAGGAAALTGAAAGYDDAATTLGARVETALAANAPLVARGMLGWRHAFGDVTPTSTLAFASAPSIPFAVAGAPIARDALAVEAGLDWRLTPQATIGVFYSGSLAARDQDNAVKGKLEVAF